MAIDDVVDDYPEYLADERGYRWDAWDIVDGAAIRRHDAIVASSVEALDALDLTGLDDLDRWAYARRARQLGGFEAYHSACSVILGGEMAHDAIAYDEVYEATIESLAVHGAADDADVLLTQFAERWPDDQRALRLAVWVAACRPAPVEVLAKAISAAEHDPELLFEIAEDLAALDVAKKALGVLDWCERLDIDGGLRFEIAVLRGRIATATE